MHKTNHIYTDFIQWFRADRAGPKWSDPISAHNYVCHYMNDVDGLIIVQILDGDRFRVVKQDKMGTLNHKANVELNVGSVYYHYPVMYGMRFHRDVSKG